MTHDTFADIDPATWNKIADECLRTRHLHAKDVGFLQEMLHRTSRGEMPDAKQRQSLFRIYNLPTAPRGAARTIY